MEAARGQLWSVLLDPRRRDRIKVELKRAEDYLNAAEQLHRHALYAPSATASYYSACHAATAAFLTVGSFDNAQKDKFMGFMTALRKYSSKLDPFIEHLAALKDSWGFNTAVDYSESDSLLRLYQTRDFVLEVKDFLRRAVKV